MKTNHFGAALDRFLESRNLTLHQAGMILGQHHTVLSTVVRGKLKMSAKNLARMLELLRKNAGQINLSPEQATEITNRLHVSWLEDQIQPGYAESISISVKGRRGPEMTDPRAVALAFFDKLSKDNPAVADWLIAMQGVMEHQAAPRSRRTPKQK